jgi:hypothetical protein
MVAFHSKEMVEVAILSTSQHQGKMIDSPTGLKTTTMETTATTEITVTMVATIHPHQALDGNPLLQVWLLNLVGPHHHPRQIMDHMRRHLLHTVVMMHVVLTEAHLVTPDPMKVIRGEGADEAEVEVAEVVTLIEVETHTEEVILTGTIPGADDVENYWMFRDQHWLQQASTESYASINKISLYILCILIL